MAFRIDFSEGLNQDETQKSDQPETAIGALISDGRCINEQGLVELSLHHMDEGQYPNG